MTAYPLSRVWRIGLVCVCVAALGRGSEAAAERSPRYASRPITARAEQPKLAPAYAAVAAGRSAVTPVTGLARGEAAKLDATLRAVQERLLRGQPMGIRRLIRPVRLDRLAQPDDLSTRWQPGADTWPEAGLRAVLVASDLDALRRLGVEVRSHVGGVVAAVLPAHLLDDVARLDSVSSISAPARFKRHNDLGRADARVPQAEQQYGVTGWGVLLAALDSGADFAHPFFRNADGTTRFQAILDFADPGDTDGDGSLDGDGPAGATLYSRDEINRALLQGNGSLWRWASEPLFVPDNDWLEADIDIAEDIHIQSLHVQVDIEHERMDDVGLVLIGPDDQEYELWDAGPLATEANVVATYAVPEAAGTSTRGLWTLVVLDNARGMRGGLISWALFVNSVVRHQDLAGHGTHVLATAGGNGGLDSQMRSGQYAGVATGADLVMVRVERNLASADEDDMIAALQWLDQFASSSRQPLVVNISLGGHVGAHDGSAPDELAIDELAGPGVAGRTVVVSAGNEGDIAMHASGQFMGSEAQIALSLPRGVETEELEIWYDGRQGSQLGIRFPAVAGVNCVTAAEDLSGQRSDCGRIQMGPGDAPRWFILRRGASILNIGQVSLAAANPLNGDYQASVLLQEADSAILEGDWQITLFGDGTRWHAWSLFGEPFAEPDGLSSLGVPATARHAIAAGSHRTRLQWTDSGGTSHSRPGVTGSLSDFSSRGPTRDGRAKPDLTAPGEYVISALSMATWWIYAELPRESLVGPGLLLEGGTSMSAPHVAGAAALLLERDASLDAAQVRQRLRDAARRDEHTGQTPNPNAWGAGKLDVAAVLFQPPGPTATPTRAPPPRFEVYLPWARRS